MKKQQFRKPVELSEEDIFLDTETLLEAESAIRVIEINRKEEQVFNVLPHNNFRITIRQHYNTHREYLCAIEFLDGRKSIGIDTRRMKVFNFDFNDRENKTLPEYIESLGYSWSQFLNYDVIMESNFEDLKKYLWTY